MTLVVGGAQFVRIKALKIKNIFFMSVNIKNTPEKSEVIVNFLFGSYFTNKNRAVLPARS